MIQCLYVASSPSEAESGAANSVESVRETVSVRELCVLFGVSRSGYYDHLRKAQGSRRVKDGHLAWRMEVLVESSDRSWLTR